MASGSEGAGRAKRADLGSGTGRVGSVSRAETASGPAPQPPRRLRESDLQRAAPAIARAFAWHEPWGEWTLPDPATREEILTGLVEQDLRDRFLSYGECWTIAGVSTTLWMPPGKKAFERRRGEDVYAVYADRAELVREADRTIAAMKPARPHWYLDTIATEPESMGRGLAARLLDHNLALRDRCGDACALDTHTARNIGFYQRRGFEVVASDKLPESEIDLVMMYRAPRIPTRT